MVRRFAAAHDVWEAALEAAAELDALMSLAAVADAGTDTGPMCRPRLVPAQGDSQVRRPGLRAFNPCCFPMACTPSQNSMVCNVSGRPGRGYSVSYTSRGEVLGGCCYVGSHSTMQPRNCLAAGT